MYPGAGIHVVRSELSYSSSSLPNNGIILADTSTSSYYSRNVRMGFYCCSNSTSGGTAGTFIGLNSNAYSGRISITRYSSITYVGCMYIFLEKRYRSSSQNTLGTSEQGIYTCRMPDTTGRNIDVNVGIYREGYRGKSSKKSLHIIAVMLTLLVKVCNWRINSVNILTHLLHAFCFSFYGATIWCEPIHSLIAFYNVVQKIGIILMNAHTGWYSFNNSLQSPFKTTLRLAHLLFVVKSFSWQLIFSTILYLYWFLSQYSLFF